MNLSTGRSIQGNSRKLVEPEEKREVCATVSAGAKIPIVPVEKSSPLAW
jgi:hypothetical protein